MRNLWQIVDELAFPLDTANKDQMLKLVMSCIGTKFTSRYGTLMAVRGPLLAHFSTSV